MNHLSMRWKIGPPVSHPRKGQDPRMLLGLPHRPATNHAYRVAIGGADVLLTDNRHLALQRYMPEVRVGALDAASIFCDGKEYPFQELKRLP